MESILIFPEELRGNPRPMMRIKCVKPNVLKSDDTFVKPPAPQGPISIYLPIPIGLTFSDGASYNEASLEQKGGVAMMAARSGALGAANGGGLVGALGGIAAATKDGAGAVGIKDIIVAASTKFAKDAGVSQEVTSGVSIGLGTTLNKNVTTEFTGVGTREFGFNFKFVSTNRKETDTIKNIIETFRSNLYPMGNFVSLQYPSTWNIQFLAAGGTDMPYLPKIFECYLKSLTSNFNPSTYAYRPDNSPLETDVAVSFIESRALTFEDIKSLEARAFEEGDFQRLYGGGSEQALNQAINDASTGSGAPEAPTTPTNTETQPPPSGGSGGYASGRIPGFPS